MDTLVNDIILIFSGVAVWGIADNLIHLYVKPNNPYTVIYLYIAMFIISIGLFVYVNRKQVKEKHNQ